MPADLLTAVQAAQRGMQVLRDLRAVASTPRMSKRKLHKASSAESIVTHVLRQRGWSKRWRDGHLTGRQHLSLLEDCRQYGRQWMRHEAEQFFDRYGVEVNEPANERGNGSILGHGVRIGAQESGWISAESSAVSICDAASPDSTSGVCEARSLASRAASALSRFFDRSKQFVKELIFSGAMLLKGPEPLSEAEISALDRQAKIQAEYFDKFQREVAANPPLDIADLQNLTTVVSPGPMTPGQFVARAEQYGNAVWQAGNSVIRTDMVNTGIFQAERRVLGDAKEHCHDCPPLSAMGWQPVGSLPAIGETECQNLCHCHFEYQDKDGKAHVVIPNKKRLKLIRIPNEPIQQLPGGPGPIEKPKAPPKEPKLPEPKAKPEWVPSLKDLLEQAGSPYSPEEYEEA